MEGESIYCNYIIILSLSILSPPPTNKQMYHIYLPAVRICSVNRVSRPPLLPVTPSRLAWYWHPQAGTRIYIYICVRVYVCMCEYIYIYIYICICIYIYIYIYKCFLTLLCEKVTDFGLTINRYGEKYLYTEGEVLPIRWAAPEAVKKAKFSEKSDVWAFGITAFEIFTQGEVPYFRLTDKEVIERVCVEGERPLLQPKGCPDAMWTVLQQCWAPLSKNRPTFKVIQTLFYYNMYDVFCCFGCSSLTYMVFQSFCLVFGGWCVCSIWGISCSSGGRSPLKNDVSSFGHCVP